MEQSQVDCIARGGQRLSRRHYELSAVRRCIVENAAPWSLQKVPAIRGTRLHRSARMWPGGLQASTKHRTGSPAKRVEKMTNEEAH